MTTLDLFHSVTEAGSAAVRRFVVARGLEARVRFRNVTYPEVASDLAALGSSVTPALWDGERLIIGEIAVIAALSSLLPALESASRGG